MKLSSRFEFTFVWHSRRYRCSSISPILLFTISSLIVRRSTSSIVAFNRSAIFLSINVVQAHSLSNKSDDDNTVSFRVLRRLKFDTEQITTITVKQLGTVFMNPKTELCTTYALIHLFAVVLKYATIGLIDSAQHS